MSFFKNFPLIINYPMEGKNFNFIDITRRNRMLDEFKQNASMYFEYVVKNGETPEILADRIYDDINDYWILMQFNDRFDIENDWPLDELSLNRMINRVYDNPDAIHHYVSASTGAIVDSNHVSYDRIPVTNREHEAQKNDGKRLIKIPFPEFIGLIKDLNNAD